jgi:hypothetical protein
LRIVELTVGNVKLNIRLVINFIPARFAL